MAASGMAVVLLTGCTSTKPTLERGWIGGEYKTVRSVDGILISRLQTNSPAARSGLREGDLIREVNGQHVKELRQFLHLIDEARPGTSLALTVSRAGNPVRQEVVVGRETFKTDHSIVIGLLFAHEFDPLPNPDFSLVALGFRRQQQRVDLESPEQQLEHSLRTEGQSVRSREGWEIWLPIASFSSRKAIVSQCVLE